MSIDLDPFASADGCACIGCAPSLDFDVPISAANEGDVRDAAESSSFVPTSDAAVGLISGRIWTENTITNSFPELAASYDTSPDVKGVQYGSGEPMLGFAALNPAQIAASDFAISQYAAVSGLSFFRLPTEDAEQATLRLAQSDQPATAWGYYPSPFEEAGDAWFGTLNGYYDEPERGDYAWHTFLHEIGHTLGLKHGHNSSGHGALALAEDSMEFSVMTYRSFVGDPLRGGYSNDHGSYAQTLMQADISALQQMYGANYDHLNGDTRYTWSAITGEQFIDEAGQGQTVDGTIFMTVWDGGGTDTFDFSEHQSNLQVDLAPGGGSIISEAQLAWLNRFESSGEKILSSASIYTARLWDGDIRALIENAIGGSGHDRISANDVRNVISGGRGNDTLSGGDGRDRLSGDAGRDLLRGDAGNDFLFGRNGRDQIFGGTGHDKIKGGSWHDKLHGDEGADKLFGGGGNDYLSGGAGNDQLTGGGGNDRFVFQAGDGSDLITDFTKGSDVIDISSSGLSFDLLSISGSGGNSSIGFGDNQITLNGVLSGDLIPSDFVF
jgi:serralysin